MTAAQPQPEHASDADPRARMTAELKALEQRLLDPAVRGNPDAVAELLAPEFTEFGASGQVFDRAAIVAALAAEGTRVARQIRRFQVRPLAADAALVLCRVQRADGFETLRSSVWQQRDGRWLMVFHQGTQLAAADEGTV